MLLLECAEALAPDPAAYAPALEDVRGVILRLLLPPPLRTGDPGNALLALERTFENQVAELENHCGVRDARVLSLFQFMHRCEYYEQLMRQGKR